MIAKRVKGSLYKVSFGFIKPLSYHVVASDIEGAIAKAKEATADQFVDSRPVSEYPVTEVSKFKEVQQIII